MISNQILQNTIDGLKSISRVDLCVVDADGKIVAKTFDDARECLADAIAFIDSPAESQVVNGYQFFKVVDDNNLEYVLLVKGTSDDIYIIGKMAAAALHKKSIYIRKGCGVCFIGIFPKILQNKKYAALKCHNFHSVPKNFLCCIIAPKAGIFNKINE